MKFLQNYNIALWIFPVFTTILDCVIFLIIMFLFTKPAFHEEILFFFCRTLVIISSLFPVIGVTEVLFHITKLNIINSVFLFIANILLFGCFILFGGSIFIVYALAPLDSIKSTPDILFMPILISIIIFILYLVIRILWIVKQ